MIDWFRRAALALCAAAAITPLVECAEVDYLRDVKPIFRQRCFACHGALQQQSGLRLDAGTLILRGGDSGPVVTAGDVDRSPLLERISSPDLDLRMPPEGEPLSDAQLQTLRAWIAQGARFPDDERPEEDPRRHWAFQVLRRPPVPAPADSTAAGHPIDAFLAARLAEHHRTPTPAAPQGLLLRRVYLDLIGLPPSRDELRAFLADPAPDAYERVVDRLLASPQYGERWGRHWMDVWRYSDWYGRRMVPDVWNSAPQIWRWRDWIVRSLNNDRGYDRMVAEMLAGDEVAPGDDQAGYATGYLIRNWYALNPNDWMRSNVEHTGKAFLGLTLNCAHCHDHKYDPITQDDYFRFRAFFEPIGIRQDRVPGEADPGPFQEYQYSTLRKIVRLGAVRIFDKTPDAPTWFYTGGDERNRVAERGSIAAGVPRFLEHSPLDVEPLSLPLTAWNPSLRPAIQETLLAERQERVAAAQQQLAGVRRAADAQLPELRRELAEAETEFQRAVELEELRIAPAEAELAAAAAQQASVAARIDAELARHDPGRSPDVVRQLALVAARQEREANRLQAEGQLLDRQRLLAEAERLPESDTDRAKKVDEAGKQLAAAKALADKTRQAIAQEADSSAFTQLGPSYPPTSTGRRRALAHWITSRDNPLTARVAVNHIWMRHFHAPLVGTVFDFGRNGQPPTHPELLDWLAVELIDSGWSMKHLHRLIVTSQAYRMASGNALDESARLDPENRLLWRMNVGRMEAELVRDSLLHVAGRLDLRSGGQELENSEAASGRRRSLYYSCHPELDGKSQFGALFDAAEATECYRRTRSVVPQQALALTNSQLVQEVSRDVAAALWQAVIAERKQCAEPTSEPTLAPSAETSQSSEAESISDHQAFVVAVFEHLLSRQPSESELAACLEYLAAGTVETPPAAAASSRESLVRVLLNHNDFLAIR